jgi:hypothetical protein
MTTPWWTGAKPHRNIQDGMVNESLFEAKLGEAIGGRGPDEYRRAELFFEKTFLTGALRQLLLDALRILNGERAANPNVNLKTSFGGGKTHVELALYHLFQHPAESTQVPKVRDLVAEAGLSAPPECRVVVLPCTRIDPTGRTTEEGLHIRTLWGEMAYRLGGAAAFELVAESDAKMVAPSEPPLEAVLRMAGPSLILVDETLHYVDKVSVLKGAGGDLAKETVAFFRELTSAVDNTPASMLVVSLTASRLDQLSDSSQHWLQRLERHVDRLARSCTPIEGLEIHEVVRCRLFDTVDESIALQAAQRYHQLYSSMGGLPAQYVDLAYRDKIAGSYPFHPELVTVLYERWGAKPGFQLTRSTLRFLALVLQNLWERRQGVTTDLIQMGHVSVSESNIRAMAREVAGDPQWETVIGSDIAAPATGKQKAKAELIDEERGDGQDLAKQLATTLLLYSVGGGENPEAARHEIRLACARLGVEDSTWDDLLARLRRSLFYLYTDSEEAHYQFRKEPNVTSLQNTYRLNLQDTEVEAYIDKQMLEKAIGFGSPSHRFAQLYYLPKHRLDRDDDSLKLVVLGFDHAMEGGKPTEAAQQASMGLLERHGQVLRTHRNTLLFCAPDQEGVRQARAHAADYLSWRKVQTNQTDWDRIGGAQQAVVKTQMENTESATLQAIIQAYSFALVPDEDRATARLDLRPVPLGTYGPGKLIAPMVWDILTARTAGAQWLLTTLTAETFLERYGKLAWPESEKWVTTAQLWNRFTSQVGLPTIANDQAMLDMLNQGQHEGLLAIGHLTDAQASRDQRDSYAHLYFKETMPPNVPIIGERWLVMRPQVYREIAEQPEQVTPEDILTAIVALGGDGQSVAARAIHGYVTKDRRIHEGSFQQALASVVKERGYQYQLGDKTASDLPTDSERLLEGTLVKQVGPGPTPKSGRTIVIQGTLRSINEVAPFFQKILKPLDSQRPAGLTIEVKVDAHFDQDPGGGLDAALDDGFDKNAFPGLAKQDSKGS